MNIKKLLPISALLLAICINGCTKKEEPVPNNPNNGTIPTVTLTNPLDKSTNISIGSKISATFSTEMDAATIKNVNFIVQQSSSASIAGTVDLVGKTATFTPSSVLINNTAYSVTLTGMKDKAGNMLANYIWSFTTGGSSDIVQPTISTTDNVNNVTGVVQNKIIAFTFSEQMDPASINNSTFTLYKGNTSVAGAVNYSDKTATFTPSALLEPNTLYTATITTDAKDLAGNSLAANTVWNFTTGNTKAKLTIVNLGTAGNYVLLAKTAINNNSTSVVTGDLGLSPAATSYITGLSLTNATGYATSAQVTGKVYAADMVTPTSVNLTTAINDMNTAYNDAAGRAFPDFSELSSGAIGGKTFTTGLYKWSSNVLVESDITISGGADDVWIFQIAGNLNLSSGVKIILNGGAQAKNIFWQVAGSTTLGTTTQFKGIALCKTSIVFQTGASINGRALAQTSVILDANTISMP